MSTSHEIQRIARHEHPRIEVLAGPGTGKTELLKQRVAHLLSNGLNPRKILILSFSKTAVSNLQDRLSVVDRGSRVHVKTCHSYALHLITKNLKHLKLKRVPKLLSDKAMASTISCAITLYLKALSGKSRAIRKSSKSGDSKAKTKASNRQEALLKIGETKEWLKRQATPAGLDRLARLFALVAASRSPVSKLVTLREFAELALRPKTVKRLLGYYNDGKTESRAIDYGDMIRLAIRVVKHKNAKGIDFDHLLVDEYQDTSAAQTQLFKYLARRIPRLMAVGDPNQAIFGFAGATYTPLSQLMSNVQEMPLTRSFRLTRPMADLATAVLKAQTVPADGAANIVNSATAVAPAIQGRSGGSRPVLVHCMNDGDQARMVAQRVFKLLATGVDPQEIAVLSRIGHHLRPVEAELRGLGVLPRRQTWGDDTSHVRATLRLCRFVARPQFSASDVTSALPFVVEPRVLAGVVKRCKAAGKSLQLEGHYRLCAVAYLYACRNSVGGHSSRGSDAVKLEPEERRGQIKSIQKSINAWTPLCRSFKTPYLMFKAVKAMAPGMPVVTSTIHQAKGKEWKHVFVIGCTDLVLPDYRSVTPGKLREERNLIYVAITRASIALTLLHAPQALPVKNKRPIDARALSRFLDYPKVLAALDVTNASD